MKEFAQLFALLDQTNKTSTKVALLAQYFEQASDADKLWVLALFSHKRPKRMVKTALLRSWAVELAQIPQWLFEEAYQMVGDLAETIALTLPPTTGSHEGTLQEWIDKIRALANVEETRQKEFITNTWKAFSEQERFVFNKLLTGGFRIGVSQKLMVKALAQATEQDANVLAHRLMGDWHPDAISFQELIYSERKEDNLSQPYPFCLAYPVETLEKDIENPDDWLAEWKWDGIRGQVIVRGGELFVWSRGEELVTEKFPEFESFKHWTQSAVLDGEILAFKQGCPLPFGDLQTRIGRKNLTKKILENAPVVFQAYDLLELQGADVREQPFTKRRALLETFVAEQSSSALRLSTCFPFQTLDFIEEKREQARAENAEGLMLKKKSAPYVIGRKKGVWWKWKVEPYSVDAVLLYAQKGHGRRAGLFTDYTFGVWREGELVPFAKAYSGLTDQEFKQVDAFIRKNTQEKFGPVRTVKPELVFEIGFEGIGKSNRHKSGVALRFPRMLRWRTDKQIEDADTVETLLALL